MERAQHSGQSFQEFCHLRDSGKVRNPHDPEAQQESATEIRHHLPAHISTNDCQSEQLCDEACDVIVPKETTKKMGDAKGGQ
eukprot:CAMPEP_0174386582 /NCGR_PEP_ID=MMETSP0811_2-20130205/127374_1 /TAXON_ID=73025 ORGANISM="Eutreptiella gymnastica-like, Strain CCMP1594" /NCGR_SAMPLE_ID=MMETSP0811_2 /ASSEMBLY_ACC=CAM_ASM_000667 /LENGTH=81 /DNA_ID=CAMNT_0015541303 /DNA_START=470 /DNA_END=715 /DNA_ORIENTATION=+